MRCTRLFIVAAALCLSSLGFHPLAAEQSIWRSICTKHLDGTTDCSVVGEIDTSEAQQNFFVETISFEPKEQGIRVHVLGSLLKRAEGPARHGPAEWFEVIFEVDGATQSMAVEATQGAIQTDRSNCALRGRAVVEGGSLLCLIQDAELFNLLVQAFREGRRGSVQIYWYGRRGVAGILPLEFSLMGFSRAFNAATSGRES